MDRRRRLLPSAPFRAPWALCALFLTSLLETAAAPLTATLVTPPPAETGYFKTGELRSPSAHVLALDSRSLRLDAEPWMPPMGEFHYARYPAAEWREELLKMKAGGIEIVSTYVFWIHHEEIEGRWDWSGRRSLRDFVETAQEVGLNVVVRCGPWCHGEVRNGGLPDWVVERQSWKVRSTDPAFLGAVRELYGQISAQLRGLLWKDGGPVIGIQLDNEYWGPAEYLVALKRIAREVGLDVPLYTRTGWPELTSPMPLGEIVPLYGVYAEGFWDRQLTPMPGNYWAGFQFSSLRADAAIATDLLGKRMAHDDPDAQRYPYLTCEIGGGMMNSYHRRILVDPRDVEATTLVKIGGGSTLPGYYMYHGGTNPEGGRTTLMEAQETLTTNYNDLPVMTYDFQAPLGEFGEVRPQYHRLRRLHGFLHDYGSDLCGMAPAVPDVRPQGQDDVKTLRWIARSDGERGWIFINNHDRGRTLPPKPGVQFALARADGSKLIFPATPVTIDSDVVAWWPFDLNVGGATLVWATAQPFAHVVDGNGNRTIFFAATPGVPAEFALAGEPILRLETRGRLLRGEGRLLIDRITPSRSAALRLLTRSGAIVRFVLLDDADSLALWKVSFAGRQRVILTGANVVFDHDQLRISPASAGPQSLAVYPPVENLQIDGRAAVPEAGALFQNFTLPPGWSSRPVKFARIQAAGPLRSIPIAPRPDGVAMEPTDGDFANAAIWRISLPAGPAAGHRQMLRFHYVGDVARVTLDGRLLTDDFYNGNPRDLGLWRCAPFAQGSELHFAVLPLQKAAPIFLPASAQPDFGDRPAVAELESVELVDSATFTVTAQPGIEPPLPENFRTDLLEPRQPPGKF